MLLTFLAISTSAWGVVMAVSPLLQVRQMWRRQSSEDVSIGFFAVLQFGFLLWLTYGVARADWVLIVPNTVALLVGATTIMVTLLLRRRRLSASPADGAPAR